MIENETLDELFESIRSDIIKVIYDKKIPIEDIAENLGLTVDEVADYLSLRQKDYLAFKTIDGAINNN